MAGRIVVWFARNTTLAGNGSTHFSDVYNLAEFSRIDNEAVMTATVSSGAVSLQLQSNTDPTNPEGWVDVGGALSPSVGTPVTGSATGFQAFVRMKASVSGASGVVTFGCSGVARDST